MVGRGGKMEGDYMPIATTLSPPEDGVSKQVSKHGA